MRTGKGTIAVFLSLTGILLLALVCTLVESARIQACRARAALVLDMGLFSLFSEYEREAMEDYGVFLLDASCGSGEIQAGELAGRLGAFLKENAEGKSALLPISLRECRVEGYTLATDGEGSAFYRQVVENWKENLALDLLDTFQKTYEDARRNEAAGESCEAGSLQVEEEVERLRKAQQEESAESGTDPGKGQEWETGGETEGDLREGSENRTKNPLDIIRQIKEMGILGLVVEQPERISKKQIDSGSVPSGRALAKGNLEDRREDPGWEGDAVFLQYLKTVFGTMAEQKAGGGLDYELEYLLSGKESDRENLRSTVHRLLLMREGSNFLYAMSNEEMKRQALLLASAITGAGAVPGLVTAVRTALLLAWAYGESLLDVRILLAGGRVPVGKSRETWRLSLDRLGEILEVLDECSREKGEGSSYEEYLWMLLAAGDRDAYAMRALDLLELRLRDGEGTSGFRADGCIVRLRASAVWKIRPMFLRIPAAFLGTAKQGFQAELKGTFGY